MKTLAVLCAALGNGIYLRYGKAQFWKKLNVRKVESSYPALTCPAQAAFRTGLEVSGHGMVTSGYYDRALKKAFFWEQSARLYEGARIWEKFRERGGLVGQVCLQQCPGLDSDYYLSPAPVHKHHGGMIQDFYCEPRDLYSQVCKSVGRKFNLMNYWGPFSSRKSSDWIAEATADVMRRMGSAGPDAYLMSYLPTLDYALQKYGPETPQAEAAFAVLEELLSGLYEAALANGFELLILGDYEITDVNRVVYPNRVLAEYGYLRLRETGGMEYPNLHSSTAFALADHQLCHIYADRAGDLAKLEELFRHLPGVGRVTRKSADGRLNHPRSGELILEAAEGAWFAYPWWTDPRKAPDYATHVDIHNKPGFDPCELFMTLWPPLGTSQNCALVKGSHGRACQVVCASTFEFEAGTCMFMQVVEQLKDRLDHARD